MIYNEQEIKLYLIRIKKHIEIQKKQLQKIEKYLFIKQ